MRYIRKITNIALIFTLIYSDLVFAEPLFLRNPIKTGSTREKQILYEIKKKKIKRRLVELEQIKNKNPEEITEKDRSYLFGISKYFNLRPQYINKRKKEQLLEYARASYILSIAELESLDYPTTPISILQEAKSLSSSEFIHDLSHIYDDFMAFSIYYNVIQDNGIKKSMRSYMSEAQGKVDSLQAWKYILDEWEGFFELKPEIISAFIDNLIIYLEDCLDTKNRPKELLSNNRDGIPLDFFNHCNAAITTSELYCKSALDVLKDAKRGLMEGDKNIDIGESIKTVCETYKETGKEDLDIELEMGDNVNFFHGNDDRIKYIWRNLIYNAVESIYEKSNSKPLEAIKGKIVIKIKRVAGKGKGFIEIVFSDNGKGISKEDLKDRKIFQKGFSRKKRGTGLGLYLIEKTLKGYGGSIRAAGNKQGGADFIITLPLIKESTPQEILAYLNNLAKFELEFPLATLSDEAIDPNITEEEIRKILRNRNVYCASMDDNEIIRTAERVKKAQRLIPSYIHSYWREHYPDEKILSISLYGSLPYAENAIDIDLLVITEGDRFDGSLRKLPVSEELAEVFPKVSGITCLPLGYKCVSEGKKREVALKATFSHENFLEKNISMFYSRNIPLWGRDFNPLPKRKLGLIASATSLLLDAYKRHKKIDYIKKETDKVRIAKILKRIFAASQFLNLAIPELAINVIELKGFFDQLEQGLIGEEEIMAQWQNIYEKLKTVEIFIKARIDDTIESTAKNQTQI